MKKKLPYSIIYKNINIDFFFFDLHKNTQDPEVVSKIASILINNVDKEINRTKNISEGDLFQALALFVASRIVVSSFDDRKILELFNEILKKGIDNIRNGKKQKSELPKVNLLNNIYVLMAHGLQLSS